MHRCAFCNKLYAGPNHGYCSARCAKIDRGFVSAAAHMHRNERAMIRDALALWDAAQVTELEEAT